MKKAAAFIAAFVILFAVFGGGTAEETGYSGTLGWLNISEEAYRGYAVRLIPAIVYLRQNGVLWDALDTENVQLRDWYFDTLDAMVMALESGELLCMEQPLSTANYLCAQNDSFQLRYTFPEGEPQDGFAEMVLDRMEYGYAFMMKEDDIALRDDFNRVLTEMKADGTLAALQKTYIDDVVDGSAPAPVPFDSFDGKTVTVAVTGCLPPMDYVAADGTPAGFNTAILAEIGRRLQVNIKLIQVDSAARALALSSGRADVAFWTKGMPGETAGMTDAEYVSYTEKEMEGLPELEKALLRAIDAAMTCTDRSRMDMPEGTICTIPYFDDYLTEVIRK